MTADAPLKQGEQFFRLNQGCHVGPLPGWERPVGESGKPLLRDPETGTPILHPDHVYKWNEKGNNVVRCVDDLTRGGRDAKFTLLYGDSRDIDVVAQQANMDLMNDNADLRREKDALAAKIAELEAKYAPENDKPSTASGLDGMTFKQLQKLADEYKLNVTGFSKEKLLKALGEHQVVLSKE